jgi:hypothetical protein
MHSIISFAIGAWLGTLVVLSGNFIGSLAESKWVTVICITVFGAITVSVLLWISNKVGQ